MNECYRCEIEKECHYPFKVCDCVSQRKFWTAAQRSSYDADIAKRAAEMIEVTSAQYNKIVSKPPHD